MMEHFIVKGVASQSTFWLDLASFLILVLIGCYIFVAQLRQLKKLTNATEDRGEGLTWLSWGFNISNGFAHQWQDSQRQEAKSQLLRLEMEYKECATALRMANEQLQREITERKKAQAEIARSQSLLLGTIESTGDGIIVTQEGETIEIFNHKFVQMFGIPESVIASRSIKAVLPLLAQQLKDPEKFLAQTQDLYRQPAAEGCSVFELKDGRIFELYSLPHYLEENIIGRVCSFRDISHYLQIEQQLRQTTAELKAIFQAFPDLYFRLDASGKIIDYQAGIEAQLYLPPEQFLGKRMQEVIPLNLAEQYCDAIEQTIRTNSLVAIEYSLSIQKVEKTFEARFVPFLNNQVILIVRDITQRKQAENAVCESEKRLRKHNRAIASLAKSQTLNHGTLKAALSEIIKVAANSLDIERTSVWLYNEDCSLLNCLNLYDRNLGYCAQEMQISATDYPAYFAALKQARTIAAHEAQTDAKTKEFTESYLTVYGITSILNAPIWLQGKMVGVVCHEHVGKERKWAMEEQNFAAAIADLVALALEASERRRSEATIRYQATYDLLTGLPNKMLFNERLSHAIANASQNENMLAVMFLDLDHFKKINDSLGHLIGDRLLESVTKRIVNCLGENDILARWGGDEFTLLMPQINCKEEAAKIAASILQVLKPGLDLDGHQLHISSSIGIAVYPFDGTDSETLIKNADVALYRAKEQSRNNYQFYNSSMASRSSELLTVEHSLHQAIERAEFFVYYQPLVNTTTENIIQMEALVRWHHPQLGFIPPDTFIPMAEENGLIIPIGEWVLRNACAQNKAWQDAGLPPIVISVNLSGRQFEQPNLVEMVGQILAETRLEARFLELEITESIAMKNVDYTKATLLELHQMGVSISMDDFGTGYSSLSYLKKFPLHKLKIDRSFVRDLTTDPNDAAIVSAIIALGKILNLRVVAEGVETVEHKDLLRSLRCKEMQGFFFSRPLNAEDATKILQNYEWIKIKSAANVGVSKLSFDSLL